MAETNNYYFYENYDGYKIAYNVWESTRYPEQFFRRLFYFDEVWVPSQWQFDCLVEQGYPSHKISIVPEGVDVDTFKPLIKTPKKDKFRFLHFGRWDYRKGTTEVLRTFGEVFKGRTDVELIASVENPYPFDGLKTTEDRVKHHNIDTTNIKFIKFTPQEEYVKYLQEGDVFVTCARSEGWNLPLIEAMACGTPVAGIDCPGGPKDVITHNFDGLLSTPENYSQTILDYYKDIGVMKKLKTNAIKKAVDNFGINETYKVLKQSIHSCIKAY